MNPPGATEHLQIIRTLMERAVLYRRALSPVMLAAGLMGSVAAAASLLLPVQTPRAFVLYWVLVAALTASMNLLQVRQQALKNAEPFWSSPTRRVAEAVQPGFIIGAFAALWFWWYGKAEQLWILPGIWTLAYGCLLHASGFIMLRSIRRFGMVSLAFGALQILIGTGTSALQTLGAAHLFMGLQFGALQLLFGVYLHFTESKEGVA